MITGQDQNLTPQYQMAINMPFNDVCISIGFTLKSWSKLSLEIDTL